jgi:hypothetical protein
MIEEKRKSLCGNPGREQRHWHSELESEAEALMERYRFEARKGLDLYTPQDRFDTYKALGLKVIAYPDGTTELIGGLLCSKGKTQSV